MNANMILGILRDAGWAVAAHNDYRLDGMPRTFWLLTHPGGWYAKGEGKTDAEALMEVAQAAGLPMPSTTPVLTYSIAVDAEGNTAADLDRHGSTPAAVRKALGVVKADLAGLLNAPPDLTPVPGPAGAVEPPPPAG